LKILKKRRNRKKSKRLISNLFVNSSKKFWETKLKNVFLVSD